MTVNFDRSSWTRVRFGDVVRNVNDNVKDPLSVGIERSLGLEHLDSRELEIMRWGSTGDGGTFTRRVVPGQTLFGKRRAYQRKTAFAEFYAVCSGDILVFATQDESILLPELLPFIASCDAFYEVALRTSAGSLSPRTRWSDVSLFEFLLPPKDEQRKIASLLWSAERVRRDLGAEIAAAEVSKMSLLNQLTNPDMSQMVSLGETLNIVRGGSPRPIDDYFTDSPNGLNWIKIGDVSPEGKYITAAAQRIRREGLSKTRYVSPGDLLLSNSMSFGRPYIVDIHGCIHDGWLALSDPSGHWMAEYLYYLLRSDWVQRQFQRGAGGSTVRNLNIEVVAAVKVNMPSISDQNRSLEMLVAADAAIASLALEKKQATKLLDRLLGSILGGDGNGL